MSIARKRRGTWAENRSERTTWAYTSPFPTGHLVLPFRPVQPRHHQQSSTTPAPANSQRRRASIKAVEQCFGKSRVVLHKKKQQGGAVRKRNSFGKAWLPLACFASSYGEPSLRASPSRRCWEVARRGCSTAVLCAGGVSMTSAAWLESREELRHGC